MPPAPIGERISYGPRRIPGSSGILKDVRWRDYRRANTSQKPQSTGTTVISESATSQTPDPSWRGKSTRHAARNSSRTEDGAMVRLKQAQRRVIVDKVPDLAK